jgi:ATP-dependent helicase HrpB
MKITLPSLVSELPIVSILETVVATLESSKRFIIEAPPGSGKTTLVPLALLGAGWLAKRKIIVLQPRRLAARNVALRMSELLSEEIGQRVGYRMRLETKVSEHTQIEVVTEGILLRWLLSDSEIKDVGAVVLDEFHERSVQSEILLSMLHEIADTIRPDLRIVLMSATMGELNSLHIATYPKIVCEVAPYPVEIKYHPPNLRGRLEEEVSTVILRALREFLDGDILVFLPGAGEIRRAITRIGERLTSTERALLEILPLYGELPYSEQQRALVGSKSKRRIIFATNIAETSLTIPGVRIVVDSGYQKTLKIDPSTSINDLIKERIPLDAATQRAGRAGRQGPGVCYRMWSADEHKTLRPEREAEIARVELSTYLLAVLAWGARNVSDFAWITPPPRHATEVGLHLLLSLGAVDPSGSITPLGRSLSTLGVDIRLAAIAYAARRYRLEALGGNLLAFLEEYGGKLYSEADSSDLTKHPALNTENVNIRMNVSRGGALSPSDWEKRIRTLRGNFPSIAPPTDSREKISLLLAAGFPDRIGVSRAKGNGRYLLSSGIGASLRDGDPLATHSYIVVCTLRSSRLPSSGDSEILLASPITAVTIRSFLAHLVSRQTKSDFDEQKGTLLTISREQIGEALLSETPCPNPSREERKEALLNWCCSERGFRSLPMNENFQSLCSRLRWVRSVGGVPELPDVSEAALRSSCAEWLEPFIPESGQFKAITEEIIIKALIARIPWETWRKVEATTPRAVTLPNGRERALLYSETTAPLLEATVQELLGWKDTPRVGIIETPILIEVLSPARRPIQRTADLRNFWSGSYSEVRKEYRGRYPKHAWPEDPFL